jgi:hypothetical protein
MVRAAFEGDGRYFHLFSAFVRVSTTWRATRTAAGLEIATRLRPMKLRFPQDSIIWITGCPK